MEADVWDPNSAPDPGPTYVEEADVRSDSCSQLLKILLSLAPTGRHSHASNIGLPNHH